MSQAIPTPQDIQQKIRNIPDFPRPGIQFKDVTPILADPRLFPAAVDMIIQHWPAGAVDVVVGIEARGFIFGAAAAVRLHAGFVPIRKKGKLPADTIEETYSLEYGVNTLAIHTDAIHPGQRVLIVDDLLATGGTAAAAARLVERLGGKVVEIAFLIELKELEGRRQIEKYPVHSVIQL